MHIVMENRARRDSTRTATLPDPLVLNGGNVGFHPALQTPPPSSTVIGDADERPHISKTCFLAAQTICQMPYTPITPRTPADMKTDIQSFALSKDVIEQIEVAPQSCPDLPRLNLSSSLATKRTREEEEDCEAAPRPTKRVITEADLIGNPFLALKRYGIPEYYTIRHMISVGAKFFNNQDGASVHIRARSPVNPRRPRVKVMPRDNPEEAFYMRFKPTTEEKDAEVVIKSDNTKEPTAEAAEVSPNEEYPEHETFSKIMPLHIEVALLRTPLLGQLLLCGHIFRGDMLEIELPHPDLLHDVMLWMYTGVMNVKKKDDIKSCVDFLSGR